MTRSGTENDSTLAPSIKAIVHNRRTLAIHGVIISICAALYSWIVVKPDYKAEIVFLPPTATLSLPIQVSGRETPQMFSSTLMPEQIATIFDSKSIQRKIIERFKLMKYYKNGNKKEAFEKTLKSLSRDLILTSTETTQNQLKESKIISYTLAAYHHAPDTAQLMADYMFSLIDSAVIAIESDRAFRVRVFIEKQLRKNRETLDSIQQEQRRFKTAFKVYNLPEQIKKSLETYARLKTDALACELKLMVLKSEYSRPTAEIATLEKKRSVYAEQLAKIETNDSPNVIPSLSTAARLLPIEANLALAIEVQNQIFAFLSAAHEEAMVKQSKTISPLIVTETTYRSEYKSRPNRFAIAGKIIGIYLLFVVFFIVYRDFYLQSVRRHLNSMITLAHDLPRRKGP